VALGRTSARLVIHFGARPVAAVQLGEIGATDTRFPFILFVSQAETERLLSAHLASNGVEIERGTDLVEFTPTEDSIDCVLRHSNGNEELVRTSYLAGCDGAHSTVRKRAGFSFEGGSYPQEFVLGDVEAEGPLEAGSINSFIGGGGVAMFFPLGQPTTWRVIAMRASDQSEQARNMSETQDSPTGSLTLEELQAIVASPTEGAVLVSDPAWLTRFRLHHRQIAHYRSGRVFLAGDAAHIHSPVGAQGMNTGIQDAWNLGWKLALVIRSEADPLLLDSYEGERWPVGQFLLRYTDRLFGTFTRAMFGGRVATWAREVVVARVIPRVLGSPRLRAAAFRFVSELGIRYRKSPAVSEGEPRIQSGPLAGDRLPDEYLQRSGDPVALHVAIAGPHFALLLCGDDGEWNASHIAAMTGQWGHLVKVYYLSPRSTRSDALVDEKGELLDKLHGQNGAQYLIRPDGYIAFRCAGRDLRSLERYLTKWFIPSAGRNANPSSSSE
jgi:2-polyprenyl-6-methoxyphenol hydroxylase-like FAD-dependent oxidoreductase